MLGLAYCAVPGAVNTDALRRGLAGGFRPSWLILHVGADRLGRRYAGGRLVRWVYAGCAGDWVRASWRMQPQAQHDGPPNIRRAVRNG